MRFYLAIESTSLQEITNNTTQRLIPLIKKDLDHFVRLQELKKNKKSSFSSEVLANDEKAES